MSQSARKGVNCIKSLPHPTPPSPPLTHSLFWCLFGHPCLRESSGRVGSSRRPLSHLHSCPVSSPGTRRVKAGRGPFASCSHLSSLTRAHLKSKPLLILSDGFGRRVGILFRPHCLSILDLMCPDCPGIIFWSSVLAVMF